MVACIVLSVYVALTLYGVNATIIIFVFVLYCMWSVVMLEMC